MHYQTKDISSEISFEEENHFESEQMGEEQCFFCSEMDLLHCVQVSVRNKHSEDDKFEEKLINRIVEGDPQSAVFKKFKDIIDDTEDERLTKYYKRDENRVQMINLLDFYKFRRFVPRFAPNRQSSIAQNYYYQSLKLYYNQIKRKLNITVDPSSQFTSFDSSQSISLTKNIQQTKVLEKLQLTLKLQQTTGLTLQNLQTQSKALQDLVNCLKFYPQMNNIPTFNCQSLLKQVKKSSQQIFRDFIHKNKPKDQKQFSNRNKIFIKFFSKTSSIQKINKNIQLKPLKSENLNKIKQPVRNTEIFSKLQKIKHEILNQKFQQIMKTKTKESTRNTPSKNKNRKQSSEFQSNQRKSMLKITPQNVSEKKKIPFKGQLKPLSKLKGKKSQSETKFKQSTPYSQSNKNLRSISNKSIKNFLNGQKIQLEKQHLKKQFSSNKTQNERPPSQRKSLDLTKLKLFLKQSENEKMQIIDKKEDYLTQKYQNLIFQTPKRLPKTTNNTPINSRRQSNEMNEIFLQKNDNIVSMKKKKLQMLKKNMQQQKLEKK